MDLPQPPQEQELKNIIDKLAQFVARNGPEFEQMTKSKQKENPKFSFLFGGEHFNYYQYKVTTEQAIIKHRNSREQHQQQQQQQQAFQGGNYPPQGYPINYGFQQPFNAPEGAVPPQFPPTGYPIGGFPPPPSHQPPVYPSSENNYGSAPPPPSSFPPTSANEIRFQIPQPGFHTSMSSDSSYAQQQIADLQPPGYSAAPGGSFAPPPPTAPPIEVTNPAIESILQQRQSLQQQINESEQNLHAQQQVLEPQKDSKLREAIYTARGEALRTEGSDMGFELVDVEAVLNPIKESCTKDSISTGKMWIFSHCVTPAKNKWMAKFLLWQATNTAGPFTHKLHIIYLMNDVLHHCVRKNSDDLKDALEKVLAPMYCHAVTIATEEQKTKLDKLLMLWELKIHLDEGVFRQLRTPRESWVAFEKALLEEFPAVVTTISQQFVSTFEGYKQQHNTFIQHAGSQIQQLEQQLEQQKQQQAVVAAAAARAASFQQFPPHTVPSVTAAMAAQSLDFNQPPPGFGVPGMAGGIAAVIDFSKPPPGFPPPPQHPLQPDESKENLVPSVPYFELPAGLMLPLVKIQDNHFHPLEPASLRLPPPAPPTERLLMAVENFYAPPSHEKPRNSDGWEQLGLYDYYKAKAQAAKQKEVEVAEGIREASRSPSPVVIEVLPDTIEEMSAFPVRRYRSVSPEKDETERNSPARSLSPPTSVDSSRNRSPRSFRRRSRSPSRTPPPRRRSHSRSSSRSNSASPARSPSRRSVTPEANPFMRQMARSPTPPSFMTASFTQPEQRLGVTNKGHQMLMKMGWGGQGLGSQEQGISNPIEAAEVREGTAQERFRGLGVSPQGSGSGGVGDPYESFRRNKGQAFITRMKSRADK